jgi:epoxide hydrolase
MLVRAVDEILGTHKFRTTIDGLGIHFLHVRSAEPDAMPLLMAHGWPGSVLEFRHVIDRLTDPVAHGGEARDAFHLVIPSMPGFGFSDKPDKTGWGISRIADALCVPKTSSTSCDQAVFVDQTTDASLSSDPVLTEIDRLG